MLVLVFPLLAALRTPYLVDAYLGAVYVFKPAVIYLSPLFLCVCPTYVMGAYRSVVFVFLQLWCISLGPSSVSCTSHAVGAY